MYVTDTHGFLWFLTKDDRLGVNAEKVFRSCDCGETVIAVPSIVLLECLHVCERKRAVNLKFRKIVESLRWNSYNYPVYPLDAEVVLNCEDIDEKMELHDRVIVATAKILDAKIITKDEIIMGCDAVETVW